MTATEAGSFIHTGVEVSCLKQRRGAKTGSDPSPPVNGPWSLLVFKVMLQTQHLLVLSTE